jgi:hypothetical protein
MKINNPFAATDLDMQDIRGGQYALMNPVRWILRFEGLLYVALSLALYHHLKFSWSNFAWWFLLPDVALLVYVFGNERYGALAYNLTHSSVGAGIVGVVGTILGSVTFWQVSLIWFAHIGFDRALGYGLKFPMGFRVTHLGVLNGMRSKA